MLLIEDDAQINPKIAEAQLQYILNLADTHNAYTRFIDALLISRPSHAAFYHDLRTFRNQPVVISLLHSCLATCTVTKLDVKHYYKQVTAIFLASRWSHPWCRRANANQDATIRSPGWWSAEWSTTDRDMNRKEQDEETRLHHLLLPIWVIMRAKMFPGDHVVQEWWSEKQRSEEQQLHQHVHAVREVCVKLSKLDTNTTVTELGSSSSLDMIDDHDEPAFRSERIASAPAPSHNPFQTNRIALRPVKTTPNLRQEFWESAEAEQLQHDLKWKERQGSRTRQRSAHAASSAFRLIATGMLLGDVPKRKLKRLMKTMG